MGTTKREGPGKRHSVQFTRRAGGGTLADTRWYQQKTPDHSDIFRGIASVRVISTVMAATGTQDHSTAHDCVLFDRMVGTTLASRVAKTTLRASAQIR